MSEKDLVFVSKIKKEAVFDYKETYRFCYVWLNDYNYKVLERRYTEKVTARGKEIEITWDAKRKISDYFRFIITAKWRILGMVDVDVEQEGKKIKLQQGSVEIEIKGTLEKDYEHRWERTAFLKFLRGLYERYIIKARIDAYEDKLKEECDEYVAQIRSFLALTERR